jgi:hypothetical protein
MAVPTGDQLGAALSCAPGALAISLGCTLEELYASYKYLELIDTDGDADG